MCPRPPVSGITKNRSHQSPNVQRRNIDIDVVTLGEGTRPATSAVTALRERVYNNLQQRGDCQTLRKSYKTTSIVVCVWVGNFRRAPASLTSIACRSIRIRRQLGFLQDLLKRFQLTGAELKHRGALQVREIRGRNELNVDSMNKSGSPSLSRSTIPAPPADIQHHRL
jgi:hypothetical protein